MEGCIEKEVEWDRRLKDIEETLYTDRKLGDRERRGKKMSIPHKNMDGKNQGEEEQRKLTVKGKEEEIKEEEE